MINLLWKQILLKIVGFVTKEAGEIIYFLHAENKIIKYFVSLSAQAFVKQGICKTNAEAMVPEKSILPAAYLIRTSPGYHSSPEISQ